MENLRRLSAALLLALFVIQTPAYADETQVRYYTDSDAYDIARVMYSECRGIQSPVEKACVAWTILNRADLWGMSIASVVRAPYQFAYSKNTPIDEALLALAYDVLSRWNLEKNGQTDVGRVLPKDYTYFSGDGRHNYFRNAYSGAYKVWDYSLPSPY